MRCCCCCCAQALVVLVLVLCIAAEPASCGTTINSHNDNRRECDVCEAWMLELVKLLERVYCYGHGVWHPLVTLQLTDELTDEVLERELSPAELSLQWVSSFSPLCTPIRIAYSYFMLLAFSISDWLYGSDVRVQPMDRPPGGFGYDDESSQLDEDADLRFLEYLWGAAHNESGSEYWPSFGGALSFVRRAAVRIATRYAWVENSAFLVARAHAMLPQQPGSQHSHEKGNKIVEVFGQCGLGSLFGHSEIAASRIATSDRKMPMNIPALLKLEAMVAAFIWNEFRVRASFGYGWFSQGTCLRRVLPLTLLLSELCSPQSVMVGQYFACGTSQACLIDRSELANVDASHVSFAFCNALGGGKELDRGGMALASDRMWSELASRPVSPTPASDSEAHMRLGPRQRQSFFIRYFSRKMWQFRQHIDDETAAQVSTASGGDEANTQPDEL